MKGELLSVSEQDEIPTSQIPQISWFILETIWVLDPDTIPSWNARKGGDKFNY